MKSLPKDNGQYFLKSEQVIELYNQLKFDLIENSVRRLAKRGTNDLETNPYMWQLEKLNDMQMLTEETIRIITERSGVAESVLRDVIENEGYKVYKDVHEHLASSLNSPVKPDPLVQRSLNALANQTMFEVNNLLNTTLPKAVTKNFEKAVTNSVASIVSGTKTQKQVMREMAKKMHDQGFKTFTDKAGRQRDVVSHVNTIVKTTTMRTYREMREASAKELDIDTFYYSTKMAARELCAPLQGQIVTKNGQTMTYQGEKIYALTDYGYGKPQGCLGINCGHTLTPFIVGVNEKPTLPPHMKNLTPEQAEQNAKAQAQMRAYEREIRKSNERIQLAKTINDKELIDKNKLKLITLKNGLKQHIEKNPFLISDYVKNPNRYAKHSSTPIREYRNNLNSLQERKNKPIRLSNEITEQTRKYQENDKSVKKTIYTKKVTNSQYGDLYISTEVKNKKRSY